MNLPLISIITIVYNDKKHIERTLLSVLNQNYAHIEYIVVDGGSTDGTLAILNQYASRFQTFISEQDQGIYDAMNKGLAHATGDYVLFMNSGDEIYSTDTLSNIFHANTNADIYYGETEMIDDWGNSLGRRRHKSPSVFNLASFKYGMSVCHQAIYIKRSLCGYYNLKYTLSADIEWIMRALEQAQSVVNTRQYVAKYLVGGMSKAKHWQSLKERFVIMVHYYGLIPTIINHFVIAFNLLWYYLKHQQTND